MGPLTVLHIFWVNSVGYQSKEKEIPGTADNSSVPDLREHTAFVPEGVEAFVTGLGPLGGDGQQVGRAAAFNTA